MDANPNQRQTDSELYYTLLSWSNSIYYKGEIKEVFEEADKEIPSVSTSYKKDPDAIYTSRAFKFSNLSKPTNSSLITSYLEKDENNEGIT